MQHLLTLTPARFIIINLQASTLEQWFATGNDFPPRVTMIGDICDCPDLGGRVLVPFSMQKPTMLLNTLQYIRQHSQQQQQNNPMLMVKLLIVLLLETLL